MLASYQQTGGGQNFTFTYTYNLASQLVTETNPQGRTLTTTYDITGRPTKLTGSLSGNGTTYVSSQTYGYFGLPFSYTRGNNVTHAQSYNIRLQPTESYEAVGNSGNSLLFISCPNWGVNANWNVFDQCPHANSSNDNGTVQSCQEFQGGSGYPSFVSFSQTLGYDGLNRLTSASDTGGWSRTFNYDQWGNPWVTNVTGPATAMPGSNVYNGKNQDTRAGYNYDAAGNLLYLNGNSATYDAENLLTALTAIGGASETILYDAVGQRVQKSYGGSSTVYVYDAFGRLAAEYANGTTWSRDYIFDGTGFVVASENASGLCTTCYFGYDHLGSVRIVMDQHGSVIGRHDFLPFGEELLETAGRTTDGFNVTNDVTQKFTGQIRDQESGEDFFNARYFTAGLGRFNSADPGNAGAGLGSSQSWNGYGYVLGNPLGLVDPSGMSVVPCKYAGSIACVGNDPDFATSTSPYNLLYLTWVNGWQFLSAPPSCSNCGGNSGTNNPPPAKSAATSTCTVNFGRTTAPGPGQASGNGAFGFPPPNGSVAIDPWALGLFAGGQTNAMLARNASQITFSFSPAPSLPKGFPTTLTLGDIVGPPSARVGGKDFNGLYDFDIYRLPTLSAAYSATSPAGTHIAVTVTYPSSLPINCGGPLADTPSTGPSPYPSSPVAASRSSSAR